MVHFYPLWTERSGEPMTPYYLEQNEWGKDEPGLKQADQIWCSSSVTLMAWNSLELVTSRSSGYKTSSQ